MNLKQCILGKFSTVCLIPFYETFKLEAEEARLKRSRATVDVFVQTKRFESTNSSHRGVEHVLVGCLLFFMLFLYNFVVFCVLESPSSV